MSKKQSSTAHKKTVAEASLDMQKKELEAKLIEAQKKEQQEVEMHISDYLKSKGYQLVPERREVAGQQVQWVIHVVKA